LKGLVLALSALVCCWALCVESVSRSWPSRAEFLKSHSRHAIKHSHAARGQVVLQAESLTGEGWGLQDTMLFELAFDGNFTGISEIFIANGTVYGQFGLPLSAGEASALAAAAHHHPKPGSPLFANGTEYDTIASHSGELVANGPGGASLIAVLSKEFVIVGTFSTAQGQTEIGAVDALREGAKELKEAGL